ncbi:hypothetical protein ACOMHN_036041 [Nucella lapillus]
MVGRLHADVFHQPKYMLSHVDLRVRLTRSKDVFSLMSVADANGRHCRDIDDGGYGLDYSEDIIPDNDNVSNEAQPITGGQSQGIAAQEPKRKKAKSRPASASEGRAYLGRLLIRIGPQEKANARYPITKTVIRVFSMATGSFSFQEDNLFVDRIPNKMVISFVLAEAYNGSYGLNPFHFQHLSLNFLALYHQGQQIPSKGLRPDFAGGQFVRSYMTLFNATNTAWNDVTSGITLRDYAGGTTLFCFDLTPSLADAVDAVEVQKAGPIRLEAQFAAGLPSPMNVIIYAEFDSQLKITRAREVLTG